MSGSIAHRRTSLLGVFVATLLVAAQAAAGSTQGDDALVATYLFKRGQQQCELTLVRNADRVQQAGCGHPTRIWRRLADGVELLELQPHDGVAIRYAPGDLRAMHHPQEWAQVAGLVPAGLRETLDKAQPARRGGRAVMRQRGKHRDGRAVELDWLPEVDLPALYVVGAGANRERLALVRLEHVPAERAFAQTDALREIDSADAGD